METQPLFSVWEILGAIIDAGKMFAALIPPWVFLVAVLLVGIRVRWPNLFVGAPVRRARRHRWRRHRHDWD